MHFFNPPPVMRLLEVVAGEQSSEEALARARATGEAMGKHVIVAVDGPGFLVNRCNRPFSLEALKLLEERVAPLEEIDRICRLAGGFRIGPFELMDLVGVDVGLDVSRSFFEQSFGEPRWRPSPITVRTVAAGRTGRKAGRGYYDYGAGPGRHRPPDPEPRPAGGGDGVVVIAGHTPLAHALADAAQDAGWDVASPEESQELEAPFLILDVTPGEDPGAPLQGGPQAICCAAGSLTMLDPGGGAVGFHALVPLEEATLVELTRGPDTLAAAAAAAPSGSSRRSASTSRGSRTRPAWCSAGSSARSSTRRRSRWPRGSAPPLTSTPAWSTGSTTRAGSSPGPTRSVSTTSSPCSMGCTRSAGRSATARPRCCARW